MKLSEAKRGKVAIRQTCRWMWIWREDIYECGGELSPDPERREGSKRARDEESVAQLVWRICHAHAERESELGIQTPTPRRLWGSANW